MLHSSNPGLQIIPPTPMTTVVNVGGTTTAAPRDGLPLIQYGGPYFTGFAAIFAAAIAGTIAWRSINAARDNVVRQIGAQNENLVRQLRAQEDSLIRQLDAQREIAAKASRANVISANRQKWIDGLREDLATFIAADFVLLDDAEAEEKVLSEAEKNSQVSRVEEARLTRRVAQRRIQLRLNPTKDSHKELYSAVTALIPATGDAHRKIRLRLVRLAQKFLRQEWLRVKAEAGEWHTTNTSGPSAGV